MFDPADPEFESRVRASFARQAVMAHFGATIARVEPGEVELVFPYQAQLTQQHGFIHAGVIAAVLDSACGYAAFSLMAPDAAVLTVEFKLNCVAPAKGERFFAVGTVKKPGRTLTVTQGDVYAESNGQRKLVATMMGTIMALYDRDGIQA